MKKTAIVLAPGFEEGEALSIIDIIRRANFTCEIIGFQLEVTGAHGITIKAERLLSTIGIDYDMIILPGGLPGATNLMENNDLITLLQKMNQQNKWIGAICAAPIALEKAGLLKNKNYTAYLGYDKKIKVGNYQTDIVVVDQNIITSRGPATTYAFAYKLVDILVGDSLAVKKRMLYFNAFNESEVIK